MRNAPALRPPTRAYRALRLLGSVPGARTVLLHPLITRPGYWIATAGALAWGAPLSRLRVSRRGALLVCAGLPRWAFGRGGTTIGGVYLTADAVSDAVLEHEEVHRLQWRRYGLLFAVLYLAAGRDPFRNRFEIEAGLARGGYR